MLSPASLYIYRAKILGIIDGDSVDILIDLGFRINWQVRVRLLASSGGVDTPELHASDSAVRTMAKAAKARTAELLPIGTQVLIKTKLDKYDSFGRILAEIVNVDNLNVGDVLLNEKLAVAWNK